MSASICTHCGTAITEPNDIGDRWLVSCGTCNTPYYLGEDAITRAKAPKQKRKLPKRYRITQLPDGVEIRYRQMKLFVLVFNFIIAIFWNYAVVSFWVATKDKEQKAILLIFVAVGALIGYTAIKESINRTSLIFMPQRIEISRGPLPNFSKKLPRNQVVDTTKIEKVNWTKEVITDGEGGSETIYGVGLKIKNGNDVVLIRRIDTPEQAQFVQQEIERLYHIEPRPQPPSKPKVDLGTFKFSD